MVLVSPLLLVFVEPADTVNNCAFFSTSEGKYSGFETKLPPYKSFCSNNGDAKVLEGNLLCVADGTASQRDEGPVDDDVDDLFNSTEEDIDIPFSADCGNEFVFFIVCSANAMVNFSVLLRTSVSQVFITCMSTMIQCGFLSFSKENENSDSKDSSS